MCDNEWNIQKQKTALAIFEHLKKDKKQNENKKSSTCKFFIHHSFIQLGWNNQYSEPHSSKFYRHLRVNVLVWECPGKVFVADRFLRC